VHGGDIYDASGHKTHNWKRRSRIPEPLNLDVSNIDENEEFILPITPSTSSKRNHEGIENEDTPRKIPRPRTPVTPIANISIDSLIFFARVT
jgi:hypothetical protein